MMCLMGFMDLSNHVADDLFAYVDDPLLVGCDCSIGLERWHGELAVDGEEGSASLGLGVDKPFLLSFERPK
jgi:hypothetical protein